MDSERRVMSDDGGRIQWDSFSSDRPRLQQDEFLPMSWLSFDTTRVKGLHSLSSSLPSSSNIVSKGRAGVSSGTGLVKLRTNRTHI
eukprot:724290-Lingulodinium_polyedra.AAC.1